MLLHFLDKNATTNMVQLHNNTIYNDKTQCNHWNVNNNNEACSCSCSRFNHNTMNNHNNPTTSSTNDMFSKLKISESSDNNSMFKSSGAQSFAIGERDSHAMPAHAF